MTQASEITQMQYSAKEPPMQSKLAMGLTVARMLLKNPNTLKKLVVMGPDEPRYVRPPREYELPAYREGMRHCRSNEDYLRPTRWCNPREHEVIALANALGAYEMSDWEFAEAAFWFVKTKFVVEFVPLNRVSETLERGTGTCLHLISVWIALCRAAGIKARYKKFKFQVGEFARGLDVTRIMDLNEAELAMLPALFDFMDAFIPGVHAEGEAHVDGKWIVGDVGMTPEQQAHSGVPITRFEEDSIGTTFPLMPGTTIERFESLSLTHGIRMRVQNCLAPAVMERGSLVFADTLLLGRKVIEEAGGLDAYDQKARRRKGLFATEKLTKGVTRLTNDAKRKQVVKFEK